MLVQNNDTLLTVLGENFPESSKTTLRSWVKEGRVTVDDQIVKRADYVVSKGQKIEVQKKLQYVEKKIRILYEDSYLVAIEKSEGLLSVGTDFEKVETAHSILKRHYYPKKVYVVHRIDQDTSGVMLFALSEKSYLGLKKLFEVHDIERVYCAIVQGRMPLQKGSWQSFVYEDPHYVVHSTSDPEKGVIAITHYEVVDFSARYTKLKLRLDTGRKNQIRVHCNDAGYPVVGDKKYGASVDPIKRLCLHAESIAFNHPVTGKRMTFDSLVPQAFEKLVKSFDKGKAKGV